MCQIIHVWSNLNTFIIFYIEISSMKQMCCVSECSDASVGILCECGILIWHSILLCFMKWIMFTAFSNVLMKWLPIFNFTFFLFFLPSLHLDFFVFSRWKYVHIPGQSNSWVTWPRKSRKSNFKEVWVPEMWINVWNWERIVKTLVFVTHK